MQTLERENLTMDIYMTKQHKFKNDFSSYRDVSITHGPIRLISGLTTGSDKLQEPYTCFGGTIMGLSCSKVSF